MPFWEPLVADSTFVVHHIRGAVHENEPSNIAVFDLSTAEEPFEVDLGVRLCVCDIGISSSVI